MSHIDLLNKAIPANVIEDTAWDMIYREAGRHIDTTATITGTGSQVVNVFQFTGSIMILNQWATVTSITTLTNLTNMYATLYDGTNSVDLTADGATLSNAPVGSFFTKNHTADQPYSVNFADECRLLETLTDKRAGRPFILTGKNGATNYIRLHYTTTDNPVNFDIFVHFEYYLFNGATFSVVS